MFACLIFSFLPEGAYLGLALINFEYYKSLSNIKYVKTTCICNSVRRLELLKWYFNNGLPKTDQVNFKAVYFNKLNSLKYATENGCPLSPLVMKIAVKRPRTNLRIIKYLVEKECPYNKNDLTWAIIRERKDILKYLIDVGYYTHLHGICVLAAMFNSPKMLKWGIKKGYECSQFVAYYAAAQNQLDMFKWLLENNHDWDRESCLGVATRENHVNIIEFINSIL